ncbi:MAG: phosphoglucomutase (alpha-D-glucose-1,6-bisphosphate-dependent) [Deltaproteobacteria bacterium]|jgi:phosphoglucomutase|nr:phosphoglucomutase (alpha-D-glucose-1,6-bisphosphate-dependent) [Deltaproteobacteria bacterium]
MSAHPGAGKLPHHALLPDLPALVAAYYTEFPNPGIPSQRVAFGTSGHRGSSLSRSFNEEHIYAVTQAVCDLRRENGVTGPLFLGRDTHALSEPAFRSALEVLTANGVTVRVQKGGGYTPTPAVSHAILCWNREHPGKFADGIVITPSHNPPTDGGFKYNPPHGGPAESAITRRIEQRANELLAQENKDVHLMTLADALQAEHLVAHDYVEHYVADLENVVDMKAIAASGLRMGVDPLGGASLPYWEPIARRYGIQLTIVNTEADPSFRFIPLDRDGKIRMDCSSPFAMAHLLNLKDDFDLAFACDPDADRHGIVTPQGLINPNHYLAVAADYLFRSRTRWPAGAKIGKTVVTSSMLDRVAKSLGREVLEAPVGFKWFVDGLLSGTCGMGCEESAGASFLRFDGTPWSTDKDGLILCLLAAEITAKCGKNPALLYQELTEKFGAPVYERLDAAADERTRQILLSLSPDQIGAASLGGLPVIQVLNKAGNEAIGGIKLVTEQGWAAMRASGTEDICKVYTEGFNGPEHLKKLQDDALALLNRLLHGN